MGTAVSPDVSISAKRKGATKSAMALFDTQLELVIAV